MEIYEMQQIWGDRNPTFALFPSWLFTNDIGKVIEAIHGHWMQTRTDEEIAQEGVTLDAVAMFNRADKWFVETSDALHAMLCKAWENRYNEPDTVNYNGILIRIFFREETP